MIVDGYFKLGTLQSKICGISEKELNVLLCQTCLFCSVQFLDIPNL